MHLLRCPQWKVHQFITNNCHENQFEQKTNNCEYDQNEQDKNNIEDNQHEQDTKNREDNKYEYRQTDSEVAALSLEFQNGLCKWKIKMENF